VPVSMQLKGLVWPLTHTGIRAVLVWKEGVQSPDLMQASAQKQEGKWA
jgi:hypothetical protein